MRRISRYEKTVMALTAAFLLFAGGWFLGERARPVSAQVVTSEEVPAVQENEEKGRPDSLLEGEVIDLNTADLYDLQRLPGIGEKRANAILAYREEHGPFQSVEELNQVDGIGPGILSGLNGYVTVGTAEG